MLTLFLHDRHAPVDRLGTVVGALDGVAGGVCQALRQDRAFLDAGISAPVPERGSEAVRGRRSTHGFESNSAMIVLSRLAEI